MNKLKEYMQVKKNPELALFQAIQEVKKTARDIADAEISVFKKEIMEKLKELEDRPVKEIFSSIKSLKIKGDKGDKGDRGLSIKGDKGESIRGEKGESIKGDKGDKGDVGIGKDGKNGIDGLKGKDGSPDTPSQVIDKIHEAKEKIKRSKIEGLEEEIKRLDKNIYFKKGGGMGDVITEAPSGTVNNLNTIFTLSYVPKTNSLILLWQGQFQRSGASFEYTISGKTITFNTAPTTGELYCWYVR
ncbi:MAG: hypothetical protein WC974_09220 [Thermoplasmata archaeon]